MSSIREKTIAAANKIYRAIFRGAPNLYTSADVNRQLLLLTRRIDSIERVSNGVRADLTHTTTGPGGDIIRISYSYIEAFGMTIYNGDTQSVDVPVGYDTATHNKSGVHLVISLTETTFNNDPTHEISGATFEGGEQARPAADHITCSGFRFVGEYTTAYDTATSEVSQGKALMIPMVVCKQDKWFSACRTEFENLRMILDKQIFDLNLPRIMIVQMYIKTGPTFSIQYRSPNFPATTIRALSSYPTIGTGFQLYKGDTPMSAVYKIFVSPLANGGTASDFSTILSASTLLFENIQPSGVPDWQSAASKVYVEPFMILPNGSISRNMTQIVTAFDSRSLNFLIMV